MSSLLLLLSGYPYSPAPVAFFVCQITRSAQLLNTTIFTSLLFRRFVRFAIEIVPAGADN